MIIRLQPDQVVLFWDLIKQGVITAYKIPKDFQQDFANNYLEKLLTGMYQCWMGFEYDDEGKKKLIGFQCTKIMEEHEYGVRTLSLVGLYSLRLISKSMMIDMFDNLEKYALANGCNVIVAEYSVDRVGNILSEFGFEKHITVVRKVLT